MDESIETPPGCVGCPNFKYMHYIQQLGPCVVCNKMHGMVEYAMKCRFYFNHPNFAGATKQKVLLAPKKDDKKPKLKLKLAAERRPQAQRSAETPSVGERNSTGSNPGSAKPKLQIRDTQTTLF